MNIESAKYLDPDNDGTNEVIEAIIDGKTWCVPTTDAGNRHYQAIMHWVTEGNTIQDAD